MGQDDRARRRRARRLGVGGLLAALSFLVAAPYKTEADLGIEGTKFRFTAGVRH